MATNKLRNAALRDLMRVVESNTHLLGRWHAPKDIRESLNDFNDDTLFMLRDAVLNEATSDYATMRFMMLLCTWQKKNLEPTIRNIAIFAEVEVGHQSLLGVRHAPWTNFHRAEKYARKRICGMPNAIETPEQSRQMAAVMSALIAVTFMTINELNGNSTHGAMFLKDIVELLEDKSDYHNLRGDDTFLPRINETIDMFIRRHEDHEQALLIALEGADRTAVIEARSDGLTRSPLNSGAL